MSSEPESSGDETLVDGEYVKRPDIERPKWKDYWVKLTFDPNYIPPKDKTEKVKIYMYIALALKTFWKDPAGCNINSHCDNCGLLNRLCVLRHPPQVLSKANRRDIQYLDETGDKLKDPTKSHYICIKVRACDSCVTDIGIPCPRFHFYLILDENGDLLYLRKGKWGSGYIKPDDFKAAQDRWRLAHGQTIILPHKEVPKDYVAENDIARKGALLNRILPTAADYWDAYEPWLEYEDLKKPHPNFNFGEGISYKNEWFLPRWQWLYTSRRTEDKRLLKKDDTNVVDVEYTTDIDYVSFQPPIDNPPEDPVYSPPPYISEPKLYAPHPTSAEELAEHRKAFILKPFPHDLANRRRIIAQSGNLQSPPRSLIPLPSARPTAPSHAHDDNWKRKYDQLEEKMWLDKIQLEIDEEEKLDDAWEEYYTFLEKEALDLEEENRVRQIGIDESRRRKRQRTDAEEFFTSYQNAPEAFTDEAILRKFKAVIRGEYDDPNVGA